MARRRKNGKPKYTVNRTVANNMEKMELYWELWRDGAPYRGVVAFFHDKDYADFTAKCLNGYVTQNPKRRKNIMSSAGGDYDDYSYYETPRPRAGRDRNPYSKLYTLTSFSEKYWGKWYKEVDRTIRMEFWDDCKYAYHGGLARYKQETRG